VIERGRKSTMPNKKQLYRAILISAFVSHCAVAMVFDNRHLPLLQRPRLTVDGTRNEFAAKLFVTTANEALNDRQEGIPLGELYGTFDQVQLAKGIAAQGNQNPLPSEYQGIVSRIPWDVGGKRQAQGVAFAWNQSIVKWLSTGFSWLFMRSVSRFDFKLNSNGIEPNIAITSGDAILLDDNRRDMFKQVRMCDGAVTQLGFGDIDWYLRLGHMWEYSYKFRRIDAGFRLGALFPTGVTTEPGKPASIPFGGNGHWGIYAAGDALFELKEDWKAGFLLRVNKRFSKIQTMRVPIEKEPQIFASAVADVNVSPAVTAIFSPYFLFENLREGLALGLNFTLTWHGKDCYEDTCCDRTAPLNLDAVRDYSDWTSEYFTLNILYDFGKMKIHRDFNPILTFRWDIPSTLFTASRIDKTQRVSLGVDFLY